MDSRTEAKIPSVERQIVVLVHGAIAGASIAASLELASREILSSLLLFALGCFAVAIPSAIALVLLAQVIYEVGKASTPDGEREGQNWPPLSYVLAVVDQICCYLGFVALFWHFSWIIGTIFLFTTLVAYMTTWMAAKSLRGTGKVKTIEKTT